MLIVIFSSFHVLNIHLFASSSVSSQIYIYAYIYFFFLLLLSSHGMLQQQLVQHFPEVADFSFFSISLKLQDYVTIRRVTPHIYISITLKFLIFQDISYLLISLISILLRFYSPQILFSLNFNFLKFYILQILLSLDSTFLKFYYFFFHFS